MLKVRLILHKIASKFKKNMKKIWTLKDVNRRWSKDSKIYVMRSINEWQGKSEWVCNKKRKAASQDFERHFLDKNCWEIQTYLKFSRFNWMRSNNFFI